jgi:hypothetical protein
MLEVFLSNNRKGAMKGSRDTLYGRVANNRRPRRTWLTVRAIKPAGGLSALVEITDPADLAGISARLWAVRIGDVAMDRPKLPLAALTSAPDEYEVCRTEARLLRAAGAVRLVTLAVHSKPERQPDSTWAPRG